MKGELYKVFTTLDIKNLTENDREELLRIFMIVNNSLIRNHIAFIFADIQYTRAIPFIFKMINSKKTLNDNGSLVYALGEFDLKKYFLQLINIICNPAYEARLNAFGIINNLIDFITKKNKIKAFENLDKFKTKLKQEKADISENSIMHFIEETQALLIKN